MTKRNNVFQNMWAVGKFIATGERPVPTVETPAEKAERKFWEGLSKQRRALTRQIISRKRAGPFS
jgi:hypothetical protein